MHCVWVRQRREVLELPAGKNGVKDGELDCVDTLDIDTPEGFRRNLRAGNLPRVGVACHNEIAEDAHDASVE
jgi:hypothetical protein